MIMLRNLLKTALEKTENKKKTNYFFKNIMFMHICSKERGVGTQLDGTGVISL